MERIEKLRRRALAPERFDGDVEFYGSFYERYDQLADRPPQERYAEAYYYAFARLTPAIAQGELIVGNRDVAVSPEKKAAWQENGLARARELSFGCDVGQDSHMAVDFPLLLSEGVEGILGRIDGYLASCAEDKHAFYLCCKRCLEAVVKHSENYAERALQLSRESADPVRREELAEIARICRKVPARPAESFYEAVQSVHFICHCLTLNPLRLCAQQFQLGHPDRYLLPYYEKDIKDGRLTRERARLLLDCLGLQINMRVPNGLSCGYMVGGRDENGRIVQNELTELLMQVIGDIRLVYPAVGLCHTEGMDGKYLDEACRLLCRGYSHPAVFNDDVITKGLMHYGVPAEQACNYIHSTCVEITPVAASNVWVASPYTNLPQLLLDRMDREYPDFEALLEAYLEGLDARIDFAYRRELDYRALRTQHALNPLLSCFVNDCLARGRDIEQGGARYNWIMPSFVGMANLVDSLYAVRRLVFEEKKITLTALKAVLDADFEGQEALLGYIQNRLPKYGNDVDEIDGYFSLITEHIAAECEKHTRRHPDTALIPSVFCWVMHERFGRKTGATPDGRRAGFPLGDGSGPCQGREMKGPTASVLSSTKWDHGKFIGGVAVNLKFSKAALGADSATAMRAVAETYLKRGGFEVQINVVDNLTLQKAQSHPEQYRDLVVRIGGYSDYFVKLSPEMQQEVILRTAHNI